jgi:uncharacterized YkwD family protein
MKVITIKKENKLKMLMIMLFTLIVCGVSTVFGMQYYYKVDFSTGLVTAMTLNVRSGPGTQYKVVTTVKKNDYIRVFAGIGEWYVVQVEGDYIGVVSKKYVKAIYPNSSGIGNTGESIQTSTMNADEKEVFNLINKQRSSNGMQPLKMDDEVQRVAKIKAQDMVNNNYFSHNSPIYGTPFQMIKNFGISYKSAGENIAGNSNVEAAFNAWMNSSGHKANILGNSFTHTGIGIVDSPKYGKIFTQIFVGK